MAPSKVTAWRSLADMCSQKLPRPPHVEDCSKGTEPCSRPWGAGQGGMGASWEVLAGEGGPHGAWGPTCKRLVHGDFGGWHASVPTAPDMRTHTHAHTHTQTTQASSRAHLSQKCHRLIMVPLYVNKVADAAGVAVAKGR